MFAWDIYKPHDNPLRRKLLLFYATESQSHSFSIFILSRKKGKEAV